MLIPPSTPGHRTPRQFNSSYHFNDSSSPFQMSPRNVKFDFDSKSPDCLQLCMDVPFTDHPYLIGPRGRKSQYFMTRYKSLIHFPDTNCRQDGVKLNNVLVSGKMKNVEEIRSQMRLRTPVRILVQLRQFQHYEKMVHRIEETISERSLPIRFTYSEENCTGVLKTEWRNEELLIDFCEDLLHAKYLKKNVVTSELFTLAIALLPLINPWNNELSHRLVGNLIEQTGCRIFYPTEEKYAVEPPTYFVKGPSVRGLLQSGKYLMGLTMLQVSFYMPPNVVPNVEQQALNDWQQNMLVHTTIYNPAPNDNGQFRVMLRSFEFCINGLYAVRSALLGFKKSVQTTNYDFMKLTKHIIPYTVFADAKLYYPLYSVDDKNLNWDSKEFFDRFYGGPYSLMTRRTPETSPTNVSNGEACALSNQFEKMALTSSRGDESELEQQPELLPQLEPPATAVDAIFDQQQFPPLMPPPRPYTHADFHFIHHVSPAGGGHPHSMFQHHPPAVDPNNNNSGEPQFVFFHAIDANNNNPSPSSGIPVYSSPGCSTTVMAPPPMMSCDTTTLLH